jgi:hypothetical protein
MPIECLPVVKSQGTEFGNKRRDDKSPSGGAAGNMLQKHPPKGILNDRITCEQDDFGHGGKSIDLGIDPSGDRLDRKFGKFRKI